MQAQSRKTIKLSGDSLFERFVMRSIIMEAEVSLRVVNGDTINGFVTGIDAYWLQITDGEQTEQKMVRMGSIVSFTKTGRKISNLPKGKKEKLTSLTHTLRKRSQGVSDFQRGK